MKRFSKKLVIVALFAIVLLAAGTFGQGYCSTGPSKDIGVGKSGNTSATVQNENMLYNLLDFLTSSYSDKDTTAGGYTGPEAWMLNPVGKAPFWTERTDEEAFALKVSENVTVEMRPKYGNDALDASVPLSADESFQLVMVVDDEFSEDRLHEMNCYYPKHIAAGETAEVRIVLEEEDGEIYVGTIQLTAGSEDLDLVHGSANPDAWYGANRIDYSKKAGEFVTYFFSGATEAHWERPMFAGVAGVDGIVHCNYHCIEEAI